MRPGRIIKAVRWPAAAALAFAGLLTGLLLFADQTEHRYAELPDPPMRVGLPPGYEYCEAGNSLSPQYYLICDGRREAVFSSSFAARYFVFLLDTVVSSRLGFDASRGIQSARDGISDAYFADRLLLDRINQETDPSLAIATVTVDGHEALEFVATSRVTVDGAHPQQFVIVVDLDDGRLILISNQRLSPLSPETDASNFREIIRGIKFRSSRVLKKGIDG